MRPVAAIDVGSNTILMTVGSLGDDNTILIHADEIEFPRLGRGVDELGQLDAGSRAEGLKALQMFAGQARALGVKRFYAAGTSALRDAADAGTFIAEVHETTGIDIEVIAGEREAALSFQAVARSLPPREREGMVVMDIGGNSTEFISADSALSFQIGAVRLTERFLKTDPPTDTEVAALVTHVREVVASLHIPANPRLIAVAGTATTLAATRLALTEYDSELVHGSELSEDDLGALQRRFRAVTNAQRRMVPGLHPKRADVIIAGLEILRVALSRLSLQSLMVADRGIRHGLLLEALAPDDHSVIGWRHVSGK